MTITTASINWKAGTEEQTLDLFEFILIITSVIYALAVAQILSGISRLAQAPTAIRSYIAHTLWVIIFFLYIFLIWWATWEFRSVEWTFPQYGYMLIAPTLLFFACSLLIPQRIGDKEVDLEAHFFQVRRPLFWSLLLATVAIVVDGNILAEEPIWHTGRIGHAILLVSIVWGLCTSNRRSHIAIAFIVLAGFAFVSERFWFPR
jgi:hypothetical protein